MIAVTVNYAYTEESLNNGSKYNIPEFVTKPDIERYHSVESDVIDIGKIDPNITLREFLNQTCLLSMADELIEDKEYYGVEGVFKVLNIYNENEEGERPIGGMPEQYLMTISFCVDFITDVCKQILDEYVTDPTTSPIPEFDLETYDAYMHALEREEGK